MRLSRDAEHGALNTEAEKLKPSMDLPTSKTHCTVNPVLFKLQNHIVYLYNFI